MSKRPPRPTNQEKGKHVINVEEVREPTVKLRKPMTRSIIKWKEKIKETFQKNKEAIV